VGKKRSKVEDDNYRRARFRWEFLKRNHKFQKALFFEFPSNESRSEFFKKEFGLEWTPICFKQAVEAMRSNSGIRIFLSTTHGIYSPAISILYDHDKSGYKEKKINPIETQEFDSYFFIPYAYQTINSKDNTLTIKVRLDRKPSAIIKDIRELLTLIEKESKHFGVNLRRDVSKKHWEEFEKYIKVYDLKHTNPKITWTEIVNQVFPKEMKKNVSPHKHRIKMLASQSAKDKVRYYWKRANLMINREGWKEI
jgi:hypothetical protein